METSGSCIPFDWPTPEAKNASSGPDLARRNRPGSGGDDLVTTVERAIWLTPAASDANGEREPDGKRSTGLNTQAVSTSSSAGSRARTSPTLASELVWTGIDPGSGTNSIVSLASFARGSWLSRTSEDSLFGESMPFSDAWPIEGMTRSGRLYERPMLKRRTVGSGSSSSRIDDWLTPNATPDATSNNGTNAGRPATGKSLARQARGDWPTPISEDSESRTANGTLTDAVRQKDPEWPTPDTINRKSRRAMTASTNNGRRSGGGQSSPPGLEQAAELSEGIIPRELENLDELPPKTRSIWPTPTAMDAAGFEGKPDVGRTSPNSGRTLTGAARDADPDGASCTPSAPIRTDATIPTTADSRETAATLPTDGDGIRRSMSLWPTPQTTDANAAARHTTTTGIMHSGTTLTDATRAAEEEATEPPASNWLTPQSRDHKGISQKVAKGLYTGGLPDQLAGLQDREKLSTSGSLPASSPRPVLNPDWVESLMGFPIGWTDVGVQSAASGSARSGTRSSRKSPNSSPIE